jgi:hypothetical protein
MVEPTLLKKPLLRRRFCASEVECSVLPAVAGARELIVVVRLPKIIGPIPQGAPISAVRLPADLTVAIDVWAEFKEISRSEAIRRLVEIGLKAKDG